jgi:hypothetical protein
MEFGINLNGDLSPEYIERAAKIAEEVGVTHIWVGEQISFRHPFTLLPIIAESTEEITIGTGILSVFVNSFNQMCGFFELLCEEYGDRFIAGIAPGDFESLKSLGIIPKKVLDTINRNISFLKNTGIRVFVGASGPKMIENASINADGILLNYVFPEYVKWGKQFVKKDCYLVAYGPSQVLPRHYDSHLIIASAIVFSGGNKTFLRDFKLEKMAGEIRNILERRQFNELERYENFLRSHFSICGNMDELIERICLLKVEQVVFGDPAGKSLDSIRKVGEIISKI